MRKIVAAIDAPVGRLEVALWCLAALALLLGRLAISGGPNFGNDSYQYISVAGNFHDGRFAQTSIVHFDTERSAGRVPAPLTTFPPGYPLAIAALPGLGTERAGLVISALAALGLLFVYYLARAPFGLTGFATRGLFLWTIANFHIAHYGTSIQTECLYTLLSFAALVLFAVATQRDASPRRQVGQLLAAHVLLGLSYWVRYAGMFVVAAVALYTIFLLITRRDRGARRAALTLPVSAAMVAAGMLRNHLLVGTWKGGNAMTIRHPLGSVLKTFVASLHHVLVGNLVPSRHGPAELFFFGGMAAVVGLGVRSGRRARGTPAPGTGATRALLWCMGVYAVAMIYLGLRSPVSFGPRMFYPLLPIALLLAARAVSLVQRQLSLQPEKTMAAGAAPAAASARSVYPLMAGVALASVGYVVINARSYATPDPPPPHGVVALRLAGEVEPRRSLRDWLDQTVGPDETILANRGQATAYVLHRNTISFVPHEQSPIEWNDATTHATMQRYGARYLILYTDTGHDTPELLESPELSAMAQGHQPAWLTVAAKTNDVLVLRRND